MTEEASNPKPYAVTDPVTGKTTKYATLAGADRAFDALKVKPKGKPWPGEPGYVVPVQEKQP